MEDGRDNKKREGGRLGKTVSPRNMPRCEGGFKEFKLGELFTSENGDTDIQGHHLNGKGNNVVSSGTQNNGIVGRTDVKAKVFSKNTITIDMFGNSFFQNEEYKLVTHARVFALKWLDDDITENIGLYLTGLFFYLPQKYSYNNMASWQKIKNDKISLPTRQNGEIDYSYMDEYICRIKDDKLKSLNIYLNKAGLDNCTLTLEEKNALKAIECGKVKMQQKRIGDLFEIHPTKSYGLTNKYLYKSKGSTPVVSNSSIGNGIGGWVNLEPTERGNIITYSDTTTSEAIFYQPYDFVGYSHVQGLYPFNDKIWNEENLLYFVTLFIKSASNRFDYANKFTRENAGNMLVSLPITVSGEIDYAFMETYIRALKKKIIGQLKNGINKDENKNYRN